MDSIYIPKVVRIARVSAETPDIKTISIKYPLSFTPGQFLEVSCFGAGEAPISISSAPGEEFLQMSFKSAGAVTRALFDLEAGDCIGIRGPFGNGFPVGELKGRNLILIAGGVGMAPLRSLVKSALAGKDGPPDSIVLLYGSRSPQDMLYKKELKSWGGRIKVILTVDKASAGWRGRLGVVTGLLDEVKIDPLMSKAVICGPPVMMHFTVPKLLELNMKPSDIVLSLERHMRCGVGKCGHCYIADKFTCQDGPVFTYEQLSGLVPEEML